MITLTTLVGALALSGPANANEEVTPNLDDVASFDTNINVNIPVDVNLTLMGRVQAVGVWGSGEAPYDTVDQVGFRRSRLGVKGTAGVLNFKAEYDFAGGDADFNDVYVGWKNSPLGAARLGHMKEPMGLEQLDSSKYVTFVERSLADTFNPARNVGIQFGDSTEQLSWQYGVFGSDTDSFGWGDVDGMYAITGRLTGLVLDDEDNTVHLGISASNRSQDTVRYRARPEASLVSRVADTGSLVNDGVTLFGAEAAWVGGPWSAQAEYIGAEVDNAAGVDDASYSGYYVEGSYYLTGESRNYKKSVGHFDRPAVNEDFDGEGGMGAIQLAARYSMLDLNDGPTIEEVENFTLGANWWLNNHTRVTFNYVNSSYEAGSFDEDADYLLFSMQLDF